MAELTVVTILCLWKTYLRFQISDLRYVFHKFNRSQMRFWQTYWHKFFTNEKYYNFSSFSNFISTILISVNFIAFQLFQFQLLFWQSYYVCDNHIWFTIYYSSKLWYICYLEEKFYLFERLHNFFLLKIFSFCWARTHDLATMNPSPYQCSCTELTFEKVYFEPLIHNVKRLTQK